MSSALPVLVVGIGQRLRGADAAGREVAERLVRRLPPGCAVRSADGDALALIEAWRDADSVILVDAMVSGACPGHLARFDASAAPLPVLGRRASTHDIGVADVVELARAMQVLPRRVIVFAIEADDFTPGSPLSPAMRRGVERAVRAVAGEVEAQLTLARGGRESRAPLAADTRNPNPARNGARKCPSMPSPAASRTAPTEPWPDGSTACRVTGEEGVP